MKVAASVVATALAASALYWAVTTTGEPVETAHPGLLEAVPSTVAAPASTDRDNRDPWNDPISYTNGGTEPAATAPTTSVSADVEPKPVAEAVATTPQPVRETLRFETYTPAPQATHTPKPRYSAESPVQPIGMDGQILNACLEAIEVDPYGDNQPLIDEIGQKAFDDLVLTCVFGSVTQG